METKANYVLIGAATLLALLAAAIFAVWLSNFDFDRRYRVYDVMFEGAVRGLSQGGEVRYNGIKVGEVTRLSIDPDNNSRVLARIRVDAAAPVRPDSRAQLETNPITGVSLIQMAGGTDISLDQTRWGTVPRIKADPPQFDAFVQGSEGFLRQANEAVRAINDFLTPQNIKALSATLQSSAQISAALAKDDALARRTTATLDEARAAAAAAAKAAAALEALAAKTDGRIDMLSTETTAAVASARLAIDEVRTAAQRTASLAATMESTVAQAQGQTLPQVDLAARDLRRLAIRLETIATELEVDPGRFAAGKGRPEVELPR